MNELILSLFGLLFSILFSSLEIALISSNAFQIDVWAKQKNKLSKLAQDIIQKKEIYLFLILLGTNISNISATTFATLHLLNIGEWSNSSILILISVIILIFGEILPKTFIKNHANIGLVFLSPLLLFMYYLFYPLLSIIIKFRWLELYRNIPNDEKREDLQHTFEQVDDNDTMEKEQQELISNVFDFNKTSVLNFMTPKDEISSISIDDSLEKAKLIFIESGHSKLPVYKNNINNIVGMIYLYDLYNSPLNLKEIVKEILFIKHNKPILEIIPLFKKANHSLAIILDSDEKTVGMVTAEDIFEQLFGQFEDEFDIKPKSTKKLNDGSILVKAKMKCDDFNKQHNNLIPDGNYETIAGYIISKLGRIPIVGENLFMEIGQVIITKASDRYIDQVKIFSKKEV